jgi:hypothetical protein
MCGQLYAQTAFYLRQKRPNYALERRLGASTDSLYAALANGPIRMLLQFSVPVSTELSKISKYLIIIIIIEARDEELWIKYHAKPILQTKQQIQTVSIIRRDSKKIIAACCILALEQHVERHDRHDTVCAQLHFNIGKEKEAKSEKVCWYEYVLIRNTS